MKTRAYILIETSVGSTANVATELKKIDQMIAVDMVTGPFDIIAVVEADNLVDIGGIVSTKMHQVGGIVKTITSLAVTAD
ncbi:MAG: Lrp/AsnC family transcriptional regulator [Chloroflexi bacterium]|nr:Lrp/AsnC family transcriptional regulator [Chloroflexota bacterium]MXZ03155.1 Lrp/AsnC family transcriptional regulator [Chloroflexota bacterium]MYF79738.1 Lrp/AsnC family transcriptional regulator [Chloroflexota bacterium]MYK61384.1 Lrp/AsnC family transcriptional regulator [Chloroflexota bacterium]